MSSSIDTTTGLNDCGCCEGISVESPAAVINRPGLSAIAYRVGTHSQFNETLLARLSASRQRALDGLTTRDTDDYSIALLDAWATVGDVLTFYQERIANEAYLRTAKERLSVLELARLINYQLNPGVAASTYLAFTLEDAPGALGQTLATGTAADVGLTTLPPTIIDIGTKVQSVPGPGEKAQIFESVEKIDARPQWNALKARTTKQVPPALGDTVVYLAGLSTNLKLGDILLFVGEERLKDKASGVWDVRRITSVEIETDADRTKVSLERGLGSTSPLRSPAANSRVYAFRQRASIFGYNAPDWRSLPDTMKASVLGIDDPDNLTADDRKEWPNFTIFAPVFPFKEESSRGTTKEKEKANFKVGKGTFHSKEIERLPGHVTSSDTIDLDASYQRITADSWLLLSLPNDPAAKDSSQREFQRLYQVKRVTETSRADFALSGKVTRVMLEGIDLDQFENEVRTTAVFAESEELTLAEKPLIDPVWKQEIILDGVVDGLLNGRKIIVTGKLLRRLRIDATGAPSDDLLLLEPPLSIKGSFTLLKWHVLDTSLAERFINAPAEKVTYLTTAQAADKAVSELATIDSTALEDENHTRLVLNSPLKNVYQATSVIISANVALATNGETTNEVLGGGDASQAFQRFTLKQPPLTYVSSAKPSGGQTTLEVRVNDVLWHEVPDFYGHQPEERIYVTRLSDDGKTTVIFGDGQTGARLPTGQENIKAKYRKGIGLGGLVKENQLTQLLSRPLGLKGVTNPVATAGAADPEKLEEARRNAPLTVLTLGRVVSLKDYEDFARGFSGIGKALATWTWFGEERGIFVTISGAAGAEVAEDSQLFNNLLKAMREAGDPLVPLQVKSYQPRLFNLEGKVSVDADLLPEKVLAEIGQRLRDTFSFASREFGQPVHQSEVVAIIQNVNGVVSVDLDKFYRSDQTPGLLPRIAAAAPQPGDEKVTPAELLTLNVDGLKLEVAT